MIAWFWFSIGAAFAAICINKFYVSPVILIIVFSLLAITSQISYARSLNAYLRGVDPLRYGARSFGQLKRIMPIPLFIKILYGLAISFGSVVLFSFLKLIKILK